jgi:hypothetical protein
MSLVMRCDETGTVAETQNPVGWVRLTLERLGPVGQVQPETGDFVSADAAVAWLAGRLGVTKLTVA